MASNPLQRQKRTSFLIGFFTMFIIAVLIIGFLGYMIISMKKAEKEEMESMKDAYVLSVDVPSGGKIDSSVMKLQKVDGKLVPSNKLTGTDLSDEEGNPREDIVSKIDLKSGTILSVDMLAISSENASNDLRTQEYNIATLPTEIKTGDYIDIRIRFASGADYIIVSKKEITIPEIAGVPSTENFTVKLTEDETLTMSSAIIDAFTCPGSEIYVDKYTDPGMQVAATPTYPVSDATRQAMNANPNILNEARTALNNRYNSTDRQTTIQNEINKNSEDADSNIESKIQDHITRQKQYKQQYLEDLAGGGI